MVLWLWNLARLYMFLDNTTFEISTSFISQNIPVEMLLLFNFDWLCRWKTCPTSTVSEMMLLLFQTLDTKCYRKHLKTSGPGDDVNDTICRLCKQGQESVKHLLSNCGILVKKVYTKRVVESVRISWECTTLVCKYWCETWIWKWWILGPVECPWVLRKR